MPHGALEDPAPQRLHQTAAVHGLGVVCEHGDQRALRCGDTVFRHGRKRAHEAVADGVSAGCAEGMDDQQVSTGRFRTKIRR